MQNCPDCYGKKWFAKISPKTGLQLKNRDGKLLWRCWRCGRVQVEPTIPPQAVSVRTDANILYLDTEISKSLYFNYGAKVPSKYLRIDDIVQEYYMICWAASYVGQDKVFSSCVTSGQAKKWDDKSILSKLRGLMEAADIIAGHNVDAYDVKRINTRFLLNGLEPVIGKKTLDTLKIARAKFTFESNKLDYISQRLGFRGKDNITNDDWLKIVKTGDAETLRKVDTYCQGDVTNGKKVLEKLMKYSGKRKDYGAVAL
jgi:hypothetical protein